VREKGWGRRWVRCWWAKDVLEGEEDETSVNCQQYAGESYGMLPTVGKIRLVKTKLQSRCRHGSDDDRGSIPVLPARSGRASPSHI
jgi:hypothetical protein